MFQALHEGKRNARVHDEGADMQMSQSESSEYEEDKEDAVEVGEWCRCYCFYRHTITIHGELALAMYLTHRRLSPLVRSRHKRLFGELVKHRSLQRLLTGAS